MRIKQSVCLPMLSASAVERSALLNAIKEIGFAAVEIWKPDDHFEDLAAAVSDAGLVLASMVAHKEAYALGCLNNRANHPRIEADIRHSIGMAAAHGISGLIVLSGNRLPHQPPAASIEACADVLRRVAPCAEEHGVNLNLELLNSKVDHPGYACDHTAWGLAVCQRVDSPRVKLLYDIYHMQIMEGDVIRTIRDAIDWIGHFHTAGNPGREDLDDLQELNYRGICRAIAATGYDLYVGHEFKPKADVVAALRHAFAICDQQ